jgi:sugar phosphate isomerase/epimerase
LGIDPVQALTRHADQVLHVQAKDAEVDLEARNRFGVFGQLVDKPSPWTSGWWRYRIPGLGEVDWAALVRTLREVGYDGVVSVEHEDPVWSGDPDRVRQGLVIAEETLGPLVA